MREEVLIADIIATLGQELPQEVVLHDQITEIAIIIRPNIIVRVFIYHMNEKLF